MASPSFGPLDLRDPPKAKNWLRAFSAFTRAKSLEDKPGSLSITDNFISLCGLEALEKLEFIVAPNDIEKMEFKAIREALDLYLEPKSHIVAAERTRFYQCRQQANESISDFIARLRQMAKHCQFDRLKQSADPTEEMVLMGLVAGLRDPTIQSVVLEKMASTDLSISAVHELVRHIEQLRNFVGEHVSGPTGAQSDQIHQHTSTTYPSTHQIDSVQHKSRFNQVTRSADFFHNCRFCGGSHPPRACPAYGKTCSHCGKKNHFAKKCSMKSANTHHVEGDDNIGYVCEINSINEIFQTYKINGHTVKFQVDTGASLSLISSALWRKIGDPPLKNCNKRLEAYDGHLLKTLGYLDTVLESEQHFTPAKLVVVQSEKTFGLLGRDSIVSINSVLTLQNDNAEFLPTIRGFVADMELVDNSPPVFCRARDVPVALEEEISQELTRLEKMGIITPVENGAANASPVVWVRKTDGRLRMCADYKVHLNRRIKTDAFPTPSTEKIFSKLKNAKKFAKLDLKSAYWQIKLNDSARELGVINTSKGLYYVNRLQMGMKNASAIFQKTMESILADIKGLLIYQDDVICFAENDESLQKRLSAVLKRLEEKRVTLNIDKCIERSDKISFLGFQISAGGIEPDHRHVEKVLSINEPKNKQELEHFLGLVNYFGRMIPNFSSIATPLNYLRKKDVEFNWSNECQYSFNKLKAILTQSPLLQPFDLEKEVTLTTDASKNALGASLTQNGKPVLYISRTLSTCEQNYSNIEREALAIIWAILRLKHFLLGHKFTVVTDHKPLVYIFGGTGITEKASARINNWSTKLMCFDFDIVYMPGSSIKHADALSRLSYSDNTNSSIINAVYFEQPLLKTEEVAFETTNDHIAIGIQKRIRSGCWSKCSATEKPFLQRKDRLTIHEGMIYCGEQLFVPTRLRKKAFEICHGENHSGIQSSIRKLQRAAWWPRMTVDIEKWVKECSTCNATRPKTMENEHHWSACDVFERLHADFGYIKSVGDVLIIVDSCSGWIEAFPTANRTAETLIKCFRNVFSRFGICKVLVTDNAPEFVSTVFVNWLSNQGITKMESPPYHPQSNGVAERAVRTVKDGMKAWSFVQTHVEFNAFLQKILFNHRVSAKIRGKSPSEHVFGRRLRVPIVSAHNIGDTVMYKPANSTPSQVTFLMGKGHNTSWLIRQDALVLASNSQIYPHVESSSPTNESRTAPTSVSGPQSSGHLLRNTLQYSGNDGQPISNPASQSANITDLESSSQTLHRLSTEFPLSTHPYNQPITAAARQSADHCNGTLRRSQRMKYIPARYGLDGEV